MKTICLTMLALVATVSAVAVNGIGPTRPKGQNGLASGSDKEKLIGAWHLAGIAGPDGKPVSVTPPKGMLIYTRDGHMSVQLMYPKSENSPSNEYVHDGYEASFGSYDINEANHTLTHHVIGSNTGDLLVGKNLPRVYQLSTEGHLIIRSARPDEHWSVTWEHY